MHNTLISSTFLCILFVAPSMIFGMEKSQQITELQENTLYIMYQHKHNNNIIRWTQVKQNGDLTATLPINIDNIEHKNYILGYNISDQFLYSNHEDDTTRIFINMTKQQLEKLINERATTKKTKKEKAIPCIKNNNELLTFKNIQQTFVPQRTAHSDVITIINSSHTSSSSPSSNALCHIKNNNLLIDENNKLSNTKKRNFTTRTINKQTNKKNIPNFLSWHTIRNNPVVSGISISIVGIIAACFLYPDKIAQFLQNFSLGRSA